MAQKKIPIASATKVSSSVYLGVAAVVIAVAAGVFFVGQMMSVVSTSFVSTSTAPAAAPIISTVSPTDVSLYGDIVTITGKNLAKAIVKAGPQQLTTISISDTSLVFRTPVFNNFNSNVSGVGYLNGYVSTTGGNVAFGNKGDPHEVRIHNPEIYRVIPSFALPGDTIAIDGNYLPTGSGDTVPIEVYFGSTTASTGNKANISTISSIPSSILCTVPPLKANLTDPVDIVVKFLPFNKTLKLSQAFHYTFVSSVSPNQGPTGGGTTVSLIGGNLFYYVDSVYFQSPYDYLHSSLGAKAKILASSDDSLLLKTGAHAAGTTTVNVNIGSSTYKILNGYIYK